MHRVSSSVHSCASRFGDRRWSAWRRGVNAVSIQRGLQENGGLHFAFVESLPVFTARPWILRPFLFSILSGEGDGAIEGFEEEKAAEHADGHAEKRADKKIFGEAYGLHLRITNDGFGGED